MIEFGKHVKRRRLALNLTLNEVAGKVGRSRAWLIDIEKGRGNPPAEAITALALALSDDPKDYFKRTGRVALTAEDLVPARVADLPPETAAAVERAVARALTPLVEQIDRLLSALERQQGGSSPEPKQS